MYCTVFLIVPYLTADVIPEDMLLVIECVVNAFVNMFDVVLAASALLSPVDTWWWPCK